MIVMPHAEANRILEPYKHRLSTAFSKGERSWQEFTSALPLAAKDVSMRGQSNMLYDFITRAAEREFLRDRPHVRCEWRRGFLTIMFEDRLVVRIKKFRKGRLYETYGARTRQRRMWDNQMDLGSLDATNAVAGYFLDELRQQFKGGIWVACRSGKFLEWVIEIPDTGAAEGGVPALLPYVPTRPTPPVVRSASPKTQTQVD